MTQYNEPSAGGKKPTDWDDAVRQAVVQTAAIDLAEDEGLDHLMGRIRATRQTQQVKPAVKKPARQSGTAWIESLFAWFSPRPMMATMAAVLVAQLAIIVSIWPNRDLPEDYAGYRSNPHAADHQQAFIRVAFRADVRESDMREALRQAEVDIVAGPSQIGEYYLLPSNGDASAAIASLQGQAAIDSIALVDRLPANAY